jgi:hypothetical protein
MTMLRAEPDAPAPVDVEPEAEPQIADEADDQTSAVTAVADDPEVAAETAETEAAAPVASESDGGA